MSSVVKLLRHLLLQLAFFILGASLLSFLSFLQKLLIGYPQRLIGYLIPVLAGGVTSVIIGYLYGRLRRAEQANLQRAGLDLRLRLPHLLVLINAALSGSLLLCLFSLAQKVLAGYPLHPKGFVVPTLFGGASGLLIGIYLLRNHQLLASQSETLERLRQEKNKVSDILVSISDGLLVADATGRIERVNAAALQLLDLEEANACGQPLEALFARAVASSLDDFFSPERRGRSRTFSLLTRDGKPRTVKAQLVNIRNDRGDCGGLLLILHDTTEEHRIDRMKSEFISSAAHNLKTPITAIAGYSELLLADGELPVSQRQEFLGYIHEKAWQLDRLINNLLDISRVESGREIRLEKQLLPVASLLERVQRLCHQTPSTCQFRIDCRDEQTLVFVDPDKIEQVLQNLISNAIKFSPGAEYVFVHGHRAGHCYEISVRDEGIGMTDEETTRIFDRFYRTDAASATAPGLGLGMSLVKALVEAHGGEIRVQSVLHQGTTVTFSLPARDDKTP
ncbi:ATP-binding protein [Desulfuromonas thiophila]|uniref:sensor histidine kinase n=1 Tax=Desulfuromonas thiophila TaxID=57664 RepID=UPI0029F5000F|nr:ATP-binding protein [Desulfuromonas thiophila]